MSAVRSGSHPLTGPMQGLASNSIFVDTPQDYVKAIQLLGGSPASIITREVRGLQEAIALMEGYDIVFILDVSVLNTLTPDLTNHTL